MKSLKEFTKWLSKPSSVNTEPSSNPVQPSDYVRDIYKRAAEARKKEESIRKSLKKMSSTTVNTSYLSGAISSTITASNSISTSAITINGDPTTGSLKVDVPLIVNGRNVMQELDEMRDALLLLKRDVDMESKYPRLKQLKDEYEKELAKYKTFDILKESK